MAHIGDINSWDYADILGFLGPLATTKFATNFSCRKVLVVATWKWDLMDCC